MCMKRAEIRTTLYTKSSRVILGNRQRTVIRRCQSQFLREWPDPRGPAYAVDMMLYRWRVQCVVLTHTMTTLRQFVRQRLRPPQRREVTQIAAELTQVAAHGLGTKHRRTARRKGGVTTLLSAIVNNLPRTSCAFALKLERKNIHCAFVIEHFDCEHLRQVGGRSADDVVSARGLDVLPGESRIPLTTVPPGMCLQTLIQFLTIVTARIPVILLVAACQVHRGGAGVAMQDNDA